MFRRPHADEIIKQSYLKLLRTNKYYDISITDIIENSSPQVGRSTFYRHYEDKRQLEEKIVEDLVTDFKNKIVPEFKKDVQSAWKMVCRELLVMLRDGDLMAYTPLPENFSYLVSILESKLKFYENAEQLSLKAKYIPRANAAIISSCLSTWVKTGFKESVEEMTVFMSSLLIKNSDSSAFLELIEFKN
ncbi:MAG: TetR/AcrR family transcriptional regulator [Erysipelotrichaceae bacterium]|nr:TetR/AcrR family transcriptional regulator [Erysipelotrichaceae bacterium]